MTIEEKEKAKVKIDQWLTEAKWKVINRNDFETSSTAVDARGNSDNR